MADTFHSLVLKLSQMEEAGLDVVSDICTALTEGYRSFDVQPDGQVLVRYPYHDPIAASTVSTALAFDNSLNDTRPLKPVPPLPTPPSLRPQR